MLKKLFKKDSKPPDEKPAAASLGAKPEPRVVQQIVGESRVLLDTTNISPREVEKRADELIALFERNQLEPDKVTLLALARIISENAAPSKTDGAKRDAAEGGIPEEILHQMMNRPKGGVLKNNKTGESYLVAPPPKNVQ